MSKKLDAEIAERVMELELSSNKGVMYIDVGVDEVNLAPVEIPNFSTDIAAAMSVVEKMYELGFGYCIERGPVADKPTVWFIPKDYTKTGLQILNEVEHISDEADSISEAICLSALKALTKPKE